MRNNEAERKNSACMQQLEAKTKAERNGRNSFTGGRLRSFLGMKIVKKIRLSNTSRLSGPPPYAQPTVGISRTYDRKKRPENCGG